MQKKLNSSSQKLGIIREVDEYTFTGQSKLQLSSPVLQHIAINKTLPNTNIHSE